MMGYESTTSPRFLETVNRWIAGTGEVLLLIRFHAVAGSKEFVFATSFEEFRKQISRLPVRTCVTVFRQQQLALRGVVDDELIRKAIAVIPDGSEFLIAGLDCIHCGPASWIPHWAGETTAELAEDLKDNRGQRVAVGLYPPWLIDNEDVSSAVIPESDGTVVTGVY